MGCITTKHGGKSRDDLQEYEINSSKAYSWDKKEIVNPKDFIVENVTNGTIVKLPNSVMGQQFIIQNCENSNIYIMDHINTASVDDCVNCNIFLGPTKGSVFLRDCCECHFLVAAQQFRARDCKNVDIFLCCPTQPIIESCSDMKFGCFCFHYNALEDQFQNAHLSIFNNNWSNIHDFTPAEDENNWSLLPKDVKIEDYFHLPSTELLNGIQIQTGLKDSTVPYTPSYYQRIAHQSCVAIFFNDKYSQARAQSFIKDVEESGNILLRTKQVHLDVMDSQRIFGTDSYNSFVKNGSMIVLEFTGEKCSQHCEEASKKLCSQFECENLIYISNNLKPTNRQFDDLFTYRDIYMPG